MESKKILWIEDDASKLMGLVRPLEKDGHKIIIATDEKEALELIEKSNFDLILVDILIPTGRKYDKGNEHFVGMRLLNKLLVEMNIQTPIIVLSVVSDKEMIENMTLIGVNKVLSKGVLLPSKLRQEIYEILGVIV